MKVILFYTLFQTLVLFQTFCQEQDTIFYNSYWEEVNSFKKAEFYEIKEYNADSSGTVKVFFKLGNIMPETHYSPLKYYTLHGNCKEWYKSGQLKSDVNYKNGKLDGEVTTFWINGQLKRKDLYRNDTLLKGNCYNSDGREVTHSPFLLLPKFPGGEEGLIRYLIKNTKYPSMARRTGIEGRVVVSFIIKRDGSVSKVKIIEHLIAELDKAAIKVVQNMPTWEPGIRDGEAVRIFFNLPIRFRLEN